MPQILGSEHSGRIATLFIPQIYRLDCLFDAALAVPLNMGKE